MTRPAIARQQIELTDCTIAVGEAFDCPAEDYDQFLEWGAISAPPAEAEKPAAAAAQRGRKADADADETLA